MPMLHGKLISIYNTALCTSMRQDTDKQLYEGRQEKLYLSVVYLEMNILMYELEKRN